MDRLLRAKDMFLIKRNGTYYPYFVYARKNRGNKIVRDLNSITLDSSTKISWTIKEVKDGWRREKDMILDLACPEEEFKAWIVESVAMIGGSVPGTLDFFPNGHFVLARREDNPKKKLRFYQTGCFIPMIKMDQIVLL